MKVANKSSMPNSTRNHYIFHSSLATKPSKFHQSTTTFSSLKALFATNSLLFSFLSPKPAGRKKQLCLILKFSHRAKVLQLSNSSFKHFLHFLKQQYTDCTLDNWLSPQIKLKIQVSISSELPWLAFHLPGPSQTHSLAAGVTIPQLQRLQLSRGSSKLFISISPETSPDYQCVFNCVV